VIEGLQARKRSEAADTAKNRERLRRLRGLLDGKAGKRSKVVGLYRRGKLTDAELDAGAPITLYASILGSRESLRMTLYYRFAGRDFHFDSVEMTQHEKNIYTASLPSARLGNSLFYYIDVVDKLHHYNSGSDKLPHVMVVRAADTPKPQIRHTDIVKVRSGQDVRIQVKIESPLRPAVVRLYYRHLDQSEDWNIVEMKNCRGPDYEAVIPGEFIVPTWDVMYAIEAVDISGTGSFYPDFNGRQPFVVAITRP